MKKPTVIDFESAAIQARPAYPPEPCGVAILEPGRKPVYMAWGHPTGNNSTKAKAAAKLLSIFKSGADLLFHNAKFDVDVAVQKMGCPMPDWRRIHDTLISLYLHDPHALSLSLKPAAALLLNMPPEERDSVAEWLATNGFIKKPDQKDAGAYISKAPGDLVAPYAIGDVVRTQGLHELIYPTFDEGTRRAYDRERQLMPILLRNEQEGMLVDVDRLEQDIATYEAALLKADAWIRKRFKLPGLNVDSDAEIAAALKKGNHITEWTKTPTGKDSVAKKNLGPEKFKDQKLASALGYRNRLTTVLSMSMRPWLEMATRNHGLITTNWNQVRQAHGNDGMMGTRTGRLSCSYFMNIAKSFGGDDGYVHPAVLGVPPLPTVRQYILPDRGGQFGHRDYSQQELRILAHFEDAALFKAYNDDPQLDIHAHVHDLIQEIVGLDLPRKQVKIMNFLQVYGGGAPAIMNKLKCSRAEAEQLQRAHRAALPGVQALNASIKERVRGGEPIRTWGGRKYFCEQPKPVNGIMRTFEYKMINYLIQGSAADCTKEALIRYDSARKNGRFMVTVHDEINFSAPAKAMKREMKILNDVMASVEFDVPMLSEGKVGPNWGELKKWED